MTDADPWASVDFPRWGAVVRDRDARTRQAEAIFGASDGERLTQLAGAVTQLARVGYTAVFAHGLQPQQRLNGSNQDCFSFPFVRGNNVKTVVHAVDEINVTDAASGEHRFIAWRHTPGCMTCRVVTEVSLGLHDATAEHGLFAAVNESFAEQLLGNGYRVTTIE